MYGFYSTDKRVQKWYHAWLIRGVHTAPQYRFANRGMLAAQLRIIRKKYGNLTAQQYSKQLTWVGAYPV